MRVLLTPPLPRSILASVLSVLKGLIIDLVGTMGPFLLEHNPFKAVRGLWNMTKIESSVHAFRFPRFILGVFLSVIKELIMDLVLLDNSPLKTVKGLLDYV